MQNRFLALYIALLVFFLDALSKFLVQHYFPLITSHLFWYPYGGIGIFKDAMGVEFSLVHAANKGAAWGIFAEWQTALLVFRIVLICGMTIFLLFFNRVPSWKIPLALILAGATGNVLDYFLYGHVVDMLRFIFWGYEYPVFNLADSAIFIGITWLLIQNWLGHSQPKQTLE